jgi:hypothetical protein
VRTEQVDQAGLEALALPRGGLQLLGEVGGGRTSTGLLTAPGLASRRMIARDQRDASGGNVSV